jgi:serine/threonine protein kinase
MSSNSSPIRVDSPSALAVGTRLGEFELLRLLGVGGFGIVYLAFDHALEREVAVKEYMPASLVGRTETMHVSLRSQSDAEVFALGLRSFVNEAKLLARFDHPSLLKVYRFWEANGTAYMAMPVLRGRTLKEIRHEMGGAPEEAWLRTMLMQLLGAIEKLHSEGVYHRDIAPDNIQIEPDGRPVLMDFGAARRVLSDKSQALTAILKPAYAPIEQYGEAGSVKQGPWTDLYALGATLHYMLLARPPAPATTRTVHDEGTDLTAEHLPGCSQALLDTIDWMLCPRPVDRPQSVAQLREVLTGQRKPPARRTPEAPPTAWERTSVLPQDAASDAAGDALDLSVESDATLVVSPPGAMAPTVPAAGAVEHVYLETTTVKPPLPPAQQVTRVGGATQPPRVAVAVATAAAPAPLESDLAADRASQVAPQAKPSRLPLVLGLAVVAAAVVGFALWPKAPLESPAALPAASSVANAASGAASGAASVAASGAASVAASVAAPAALPASASAAALAPAAEVTTVVVPATEPVKTVEVPATPAAPAKGRAPVTPPPAKATEAKPKPKPEAALPTPAAPVPAPIVESAGPGPACGSREGIRFHVCMERECVRPDFATHSACLRWKQDAKRE